jgi:hypothetical protein
MCEKVPNLDFDFSTFGQLSGIISHCAAVPSGVAVTVISGLLHDVISGRVSFSTNLGS